MILFSVRMIEYFVSNIVLSCIVSFLTIQGVIPETFAWRFATMLFCIIILLAYLFRCLLAYMFLVVNKRVYYKTNLAVFILFFLISLFMYKLDIEPLLTYLFYPYKILELFGINKFYSVTFVNIIMLACILLTPKHYEFIKRKDGYEYDIWSNL